MGLPSAAVPGVITALLALAVVLALALLILLVLRDRIPSQATEVDIPEACPLCSAPLHLVGGGATVLLPERGLNAYRCNNGHGWHETATPVAVALAFERWPGGDKAPAGGTST